MCKWLYTVGKQRDSFGVHIAHSFVHIVFNSVHIAYNFVHICQQVAHSMFFVVYTMFTKMYNVINQLFVEYSEKGGKLLGKLQASYRQVKLLYEESNQDIKTR